MTKIDKIMLAIVISLILVFVALLVVVPRSEARGFYPYHRGGHYYYYPHGWGFIVPPPVVIYPPYYPRPYYGPLSYYDLSPPYYYGSPDYGEWIYIPGQGSVWKPFDTNDPRHPDFCIHYPHLCR